MGDYSPHFSHYELECHCGCHAIKMDDEFMDLFEALRLLYGKSISPSSAYRCAVHNNNISKTGIRGPHTQGKAVDIPCSGPDAGVIIRLAVVVGFSGIGINQSGDRDKRMIHLDTVKRLDESTPNQLIVWSYM